MIRFATKVLNCIRKDFGRRHVAGVRLDAKVDVVEERMRVLVAGKSNSRISKELQTEKVSHCMILSIESKDPSIRRLRVDYVFNLSLSIVLVKKEGCCSFWGIHDDCNVCQFLRECSS
jgi:hypothetical protein